MKEYILDRIQQLKNDNKDVIIFPIQRRQNEKENPPRRKRTNSSILDMDESTIQR